MLEPWAGSRRKPAPQMKRSATALLAVSQHRGRRCCTGLRAQQAYEKSFKMNHNTHTRGSAQQRGMSTDRREDDVRAHHNSGGCGPAVALAAGTTDAAGRAVVVSLSITQRTTT